MNTLEEQYKKRKYRYDRLSKSQKETMNFISALRFIIFIAFVTFGIFFYTIKKYYIGSIVVLGLITLFTISINKHSRLRYRRKCSLMISEINDEDCKRLNGEWKSFKDKGEEFIDDEHNYSKDLDIFGRGSLFQFINIANTYLGRKKLSYVLTSPKYSIEDIYHRQEAVKELAANLAWRQRFIAEGKIAVEKMENPEFLLKWAKEKSNLFSSPLIIIVSSILPVITIAIILFYFIMKNIPYYFPIIAIAIQILILKLNAEESDKMLDLVYKYKKDIEAYNKMLKLIEKKKFKSSYLIKIKRNLINEENQTATDQINKFVRLVSVILDRKNFLYSVINFITLWEFHCSIKLEQWKRKSGVFIEQWLNAIAEIEALSSLSIIKYNYPEWVMPELKNDFLIFKAKNLGHPLLAKNRVCNDLQMGNFQSILLITGSNMSGKSTFLRTAGINLVLAYSGAPVCAENFTCSIMNIYTCMRVGDNLEESISSFYAELLRIRKLMDATKSNEQFFFLLDEIFRGTNSKDRHTGARTLIEKLSKVNALGIVSTHDLDLADMEETNKKVKNYNFREYYSNNEIKFDYKLRRGVSTTRNAIYLMRMAGIEVDEND